MDKARECSDSGPITIMNTRSKPHQIPHAQILHRFHLLGVLFIFLLKEYSLNVSKIRVISKSDNISKSSFHFLRKDIVSIDMEDNIGMVNKMDIVDCIIILIIKFLWNQPQQSINQKGVIYCIHSSSEAPVYIVE